MSGTLISTVYSHDSIVLAITKFSIEKLILLVDDKPDTVQAKAIESIRSTYSKVIDVSEKKIPIYDVMGIAEACVNLINSIPEGEKLIVNVTPSRKTQAFGLLYACFRKTDRIDKIIYITEDKNEVVILPILDFSLSDSQVDILENIKPKTTINDLEKKLKGTQSRAMIYRNIKDLRHKGILEDDGRELKITQAGKIAMMS